MIVYTLNLCLLYVFVQLSVEKVEGLQFENYLKKIEEAPKGYKACKGNCTCHASVIDQDLKVWKERNGITKQDVEKGLKKSTHYQIINHKLYREKRCPFPIRCSGVEHFILEIINDLPDMEFGLNVLDWPISMKHASPGPDPLPIFSFSKVYFSNWDILYPAWTFWKGGPSIQNLYPNGLGRWDLMREELEKKAKEFPWAEKQEIGFFRGSRTSGKRDPLIRLSRQQPDLIDAQYTKSQAWLSKKDSLGEDPSEPVHLKDHCKYKYLFNFRGVGASFRFKHLFLCGSLVFHVEDEWVEFFYPAMKPWIHYVPVGAELKEVEELLLFAKEHDKVVEKIAKRGMRFVQSRLKMEDVSCYWKTLLKEYASLLTYKVKRNDEYKEIQEEKPTEHNPSKTEL